MRPSDHSGSSILLQSHSATFISDDIFCHANLYHIHNTSVLEPLEAKEYKNLTIWYLAYALAIRRGSRWLWEECTQFGHVHLLLTSLKDEQTCGRNGKDFWRENPSEEVKSMVIRASWCEGHLSVCRWEARPLLRHDTPRPTSFPLHLPHNPFPSSARRQIITEHYNLFHDRGRRLTEEGSTMPDGHDGGRTRWQWQPPLPLWLPGNGSKDCESWARAGAVASSNPLRKLEWRKQDGASTLTHSPLHCTLISHNCIYSQIQIPVLLLRISSNGNLLCKVIRKIFQI